MKQFLLLAAVWCTGLAAAAQAKDTTLQEYVGKYSFPEGSFVSAAEITLQDSVLSVSSVQGSSALQRRGRDTFALAAFENGRMYFLRNTAGKIARIKVEVGDMLLEGTKDGVSTALLRRDWYFENRKQKQAR